MLIHGESALDDNGEIVKARRMDSQVKYGVIARGGADIFLRFTKTGYQEWIWDHAAGGVIISEAGGVQSDTEGNPLDFSHGEKLPKHIGGIIASSNQGLQEELIKFHRSLDK